jgi:hypothetical protein
METRKTDRLDLASVIQNNGSSLSGRHRLRMISLDPIPALRE